MKHAKTAKVVLKAGRPCASHVSTPRFGRLRRDRTRARNLPAPELDVFRTYACFPENLGLAHCGCGELFPTAQAGAYPPQDLRGPRGNTVRNIDCIGRFHNRKRRPSYANDLLPAAFEKQYFNWLGSVQESQGDSMNGGSGKRQDLTLVSPQLSSAIL